LKFNGRFPAANSNERRPLADPQRSDDIFKGNGGLLILNLPLTLALDNTSHRLCTVAVSLERASLQGTRV